MIMDRKLIATFKLLLIANVSSSKKLKSILKVVFPHETTINILSMKKIKDLE